MHMRVCSVTQSCLTLCDPMDCSPPGSSARGILQARILEGVAVLSSRGSSQPRNDPASPALPMDSLLLSPEGSPTKTYLATGHFILQNSSPSKGKAPVQNQLFPTALSAGLHKVKSWAFWTKWFISLCRECQHHMYKRFLSSIPEDVIIISCNVSNYDRPGLVDLEVW